MIESVYQALVDSNELVEDHNQKRVIQALQQLHDELSADNPDDSTIIDRFTTFLSRKSNTRSIQGLYIWGGVGRGKTFLMDMFFSNLHFQDKLRLHFHRFMDQAHSMLKNYRDQPDPLKLVAKEFSSKAKVLCFDEFFVNDIGDAMILAGLLEGLFENNVALIATSNVEPTLLYKDGLQRERFLPTIELLQKHTKVIHLEGETDHRFEFLQKNDLYNSPIDVDSHDWLEHRFLSLATERSNESWEILKINGRAIRSIRHAEGIAWFDFQELCDTPRNASDYIAVAKEFNTVLLSHVPIFNGKDDQARRFITLIDEFYDRNVKLILSAETTPDKLYLGSRLQSEFERTISRLTEMQSHEYLEKQHQPN
ncbi:MAG: cell division protein ZapE [Pseudomonadota bacterium]